MKCSSCGEDRPVQMRNSKLMPGNRLFICEFCTNMEPRYLVVLYGRANGLTAISDYVRKRRYRGKDILAEELI